MAREKRRKEREADAVLTYEGRRCYVREAGEWCSFCTWV